MTLLEAYELFTDRELTTSQRHFSSVWLNKCENYLSQNRHADLSAADAVTLWKSLQAERFYELAVLILADLLEAA